MLNVSPRGIKLLQRCIGALTTGELVVGAIRILRLSSKILDQAIRRVRGASRFDSTDELESRRQSSLT